MKTIGMLLVGLACSSLAQADFINGGFEQDFDTNPSMAYVTIPGWTSYGYVFNGYAPGLTLPPRSLDDIKLTRNGYGITDVILGSNQSLDDYFLAGLLPASTIRLPKVETKTASINVKWQHNIKSVSGTSAKPSGWKTYGKQATALHQTITIGNGDLSPDNKVHIYFKIAPVMENPAHTAKEQPFYAIQINNHTTGRSSNNPLFFQWSYAAQPGVPWKTFSTKPPGTPPNSGSNITYNYTDWQNYDLSYTNTDIHVGDQIELIVLAAGCSPGGHDGHIYLDQVSTQNQSGSQYPLSIAAEGPPLTQIGGTYSYTYTYTNSGADPVSGIYIDIQMPQAQNSPTAASGAPYELIFSDYNLQGGTNLYPLDNCSLNPSTNILHCTRSNPLPAGASGTFIMTVIVPPEWQTSYGPINHGNYPIGATNSGNSVSPTLGNLVQTNLLAGVQPNPASYLVVDTSGLLIPGQQADGPSITYDNNSGRYPDYHGFYTCTNNGPATAVSATCDISNLPNQINKGQCTISPSSTVWNQTADIPVGATVTCQVAGTTDYTTSTQLDVLVSSEASNNTNSTTNKPLVPFYIYINPESVPASLNGSPVIIPAKVCCGRPVALYDLVGIASDLAATYSVIYQTGNIQCQVGQRGGNYYVKIFGRPGSCTVQGSKNGEISAPLVLEAI